MSILNEYLKIDFVFIFYNFNYLSFYHLFIINLIYKFIFIIINIRKVCFNTLIFL